MRIIFVFEYKYKYIIVILWYSNVSLVKNIIVKVYLVEYYDCFRYVFVLFSLILLDW